GPDAVRAQLRLTTIEPSDDTRRIMERVLAASAKSSKSPLAAALSLPIEARAWSTLLPLRDPFKFAEAPRRRGPAIAVAPGSPPRRRQGDNDALCSHDSPCPLGRPVAGAGPVAGRRMWTATPDRSDDHRSSRR